MTTAKTKSAAAKSMMENPFAAAAPNGEAATQAWMEAWRRSMALSEEMQRFAMARAEHNMKMFHKLSECRTPYDVMEVCTQAFQVAADDYAAEPDHLRDVSETKPGEG